MELLVSEYSTCSCTSSFPSVFFFFFFDINQSHFPEVFLSFSLHHHPSLAI